MRILRAILTVLYLVYTWQHLYNGLWALVLPFEYMVGIKVSAGAVGKNILEI